MARPIGPRRVRRYPPEFKLQAVKLTQVDGVKVGDVAEALDIHPWMLSRWRTEASKGLIKARTSLPKEIRKPKVSAAELDAYARLKKSHALLKEEHEILKKFIRFSSEQKRTDSNS
jgi:transposase